MKKILWIAGGLFFMGSGCLFGQESAPDKGAESSAEKVQKLQEWRAFELYASCGQFRDIEHEIAQLKLNEGEGAERAYFPWLLSWGICVAHFLPFLVWQLAFLVSLVLLLFYARLSYKDLLLGFLSVFFATVLACGYFERSCEWKIISCRKDLHIGPGYGYPIHIPLPLLEEVRVLKRRVVDGRTWMFVKCRDREGWIEDDERACSS
ncbi:TPA: hypothetical protein DDZ86_05220 [Candidatus Dependentiae bacterium]|nr:hypothetical protein [Candidatus Dependentiae bacterium]